MNTQINSKSDEFLCELLQQKFIPCIKDEVSNAKNGKIPQELLKALQIIIHDSCKTGIADKLSLLSELNNSIAWRDLCQENAHFRAANEILEITNLYLKCEKSALIPKLQLKELNKGAEQPLSSSLSCRTGKEQTSVLNRIARTFLSPKKDSKQDLSAIKKLLSDILHCVDQMTLDHDKFRDTLQEFCNQHTTMPSEEKTASALCSLSQKEWVTIYFIIERFLRSGKMKGVDEDFITLMELIANSAVNALKKTLKETPEKSLEESQKLGSDGKLIFNDLQASEAFLHFLDDPKREKASIEAFRCLVEYKKSLKKTNELRVVFQRFLDNQTCFNLSQEQKRCETSEISGHFVDVEKILIFQLSENYLKGLDSGSNLFSKSLPYLHMLVDKKLPLPIEPLSVKK